MTDCSINENYAANGGGMYILGEANLVRCYIHDNVAIGVEHGAGGAGLFVGQQWDVLRLRYYAGTAIIIDSYIYDNRAQGRV